MKKRYPVTAVLIVGAVLIASATVGFPWTGPVADASGAACAEDGTRGTPARFEVFNRENGNYGSPGSVVDVALVADPPLSLPAPVFAPASIPNTGNASAVATAVIPANYAGTLKLTYRMAWSGSDGADLKPGRNDPPARIELGVYKCEPPATTTTSTTSTSTTSTSTTSTSTTSTTLPTSTTTRPTTTTTTRPTTTTTAPTTTTQASTTSTTPTTAPATTSSTTPSTTAPTPPPVKAPSVEIGPASVVVASPRFAG